MIYMVTSKLLGATLFACSVVTFLIYKILTDDVKIVLFIASMFLLFAIAAFTRLRSNPETLANYHIVITDCTPETIGFYIADILLSYGVYVHTCYVTPNNLNQDTNDNLQEMQKLQHKYGKDDRGIELFHIVNIESYDYKQLRKFAKRVDYILGSKFLHAVVNTNGTFYCGEVELTPIETHQHLFEDNYLKVVKFTKAFAPLIKEAKGRFINFSSSEGRLGKPFCSAFVASRYALEGFTDCLRHEMRHVDVKVVLIEPCEFTMSISKPYNLSQLENDFEMIWSETSQSNKDYYGDQFHQNVKLLVMKQLQLHNYKLDENRTQPVIKAVLEALASDLPKDRYLIADKWDKKNILRSLTTYAYKTSIIATMFLPATVVDFWYDLLILRQQTQPKYLLDAKL